MQVRIYKNSLTGTTDWDGRFCKLLMTIEIIKFSGGGEVLAKKYELNFLGRIPIDPNFGHELDNGRKFSQAFKNSSTAKSIQSIVELMPV